MEFERLDLHQPYYERANVYRIGDTLVDTGHSCSESENSILEALDDGVLGGIDRVLLTHCHIDHVGGSLSIPELTELPHVVSQETENVLERYTEYLGEAGQEMIEFASGLFPDVVDEDSIREHNESYFTTHRKHPEEELFVDRIITDGDSIHLGEYECEVVYTPGHADGHVSIYHRDSGVMLSGDIVAPNGHFPYGAVHWDVGAYKRSLRRIRECGPSLLLPGHGSPMEDPLARVEDALTKVEQTESAILRTLDEQGSLAAHEIAVEALNASGASVRFLTYVTSAYVYHLAERGHVDIERRPYAFVHAD